MERRTCKEENKENNTTRTKSAREIGKGKRVILDIVKETETGTEQIVRAVEVAVAVAVVVGVMVIVIGLDLEGEVIGRGTEGQGSEAVAEVDGEDVGVIVQDVAGG